LMVKLVIIDGDTCYNWWWHLL